MHIPHPHTAFTLFKAHHLRLFLCLNLILHFACGREWKSPIETPEVLPTEGLVAWYPFNGNANDESVNGNHATLAGPLLAPDRFGRAGKAYAFDGVDDHIKLPNDLIKSCLPITVTMWIKTAKSGAVLGYQDVTYPNQPYNHVPAFYVDTDGKARGMFWPGASSVMLVSAETYDDSQWHFVVLVVTTLNQYLYCDSRQIASLTGSVDYRSMIYNQIGAAFSSSWPSTSGGWMMFNGSIDDVRIYNRALTREEIVALYHEGGFVPPLSRPNPSAIGISDSAIKIQWPGVFEARQYILEQSANETGPFKSLYSGADTIFIHSGLTRAERVWYRLKANSGSRSSAWSDTVSAVAFSFEGWVLNPANGHYYFLLECGDCLECKEKALSMRAQLATIKNKSENDWLAHTFHIPESDSKWIAWIGFFDDGQEGQWQWMSGEPITFTNWNWGEPNGGTGENYAAMDISNNYGHFGGWNDLGHSNFLPAKGAIIEFTQSNQ